MLNYFHQLPTLAILAVVLFVLISTVLIAPDIGARVFKLLPNKDRDDAAFDAFKAAMSITGIVLAFSLVQATANLRAIEIEVAKEASSLASADRIMLRMGVPAFMQMRPLVAAYGDSMVKDEWPQLAKQQRSLVTEAAYTSLSKSVRAAEVSGGREGAMYNELLKVLDDMADHREQIIADSEMGLPSIFWTTIAGLILIGFALATLSSPSLMSRTVLAATTTAVGLLLAFVIIMDVPFAGETNVSAREIQNVLIINARRV